jgi:hypothetical protein
VCEGMKNNHQRPLSEAHAQQITDRVGLLALKWDGLIQATDQLPKEEEVAVIGVGTDAACLLMTRAAPVDDTQPVTDGRKGRKTEWRQATVGTVAFYNKKGDRLKTFYVAQGPPENAKEGKTEFWDCFENEVARIRKLYPNALPIGITDGAVDLMARAEKHTTHQILDYFHAVSYVTTASKGYFKEPEEAEAWASVVRHELLEVPGAIHHILSDLKAQLISPDLIADGKEGLEKTIGYFEARIDKMDYAAYQAKNWPIGSGVTEAACKLIVKNRFGGPGMKWSFGPAMGLMKIRCLLKSDGRWDMLWTKICQSAL